MSGRSAFEKRLKRLIVARPKAFFAATSPGLEPLCLRELSSLFPEKPAARVTDGGVAFSGLLADGYWANLCLRTANRILMRILTFKASNFVGLEKKLAAIPWELYLSPAAAPRFDVVAHRSRLYHGKAIAERFERSIAERLPAPAAPQPTAAGLAATQRIFVRVVDDRFTISLDMSGENLYRRGIKKRVADAPLRETIAAAALMLAAYSPDEPLIDPMCGSGTFALEAAMQAHNIPVGWFRNFAFSIWPAFSLTRKRWAYARKRRGRLITEEARAAIFAADVDPAACKALAENAAAAGFERTIGIANRDFFDLTPREFGEGTGLLTINPPFGRRLGSTADSNRLFQNLCDRLAAVWQGWKVVLIVPRRHLLEKISFPRTVHAVRHGGLRLFIATGRVGS